MRVALALVLVASGLGCGLDTFSGIPEETAFDSAIAFSICGGWQPAPPREGEWRLFDVSFGRLPPETEPNGMKRVAEVGGYVVHQFATPNVFRAVLETDRDRWPLAVFRAIGVTEPDDYHLWVSVHIAYEVPYRLSREDSLRLTAALDSLGVDEIADVFRAEWGTRWTVRLDDAIVPRLRAREDVLGVFAYVEPLYCAIELSGDRPTPPEPDPDVVAR